MSNQMFITLPAETVEALVGALGAYAMPEMFSKFATEMGLDIDGLRAQNDAATKLLVFEVITAIESGPAQPHTGIPSGGSDLDPSEVVVPHASLMGSMAAALAMAETLRAAGHLQGDR
jgi:hypothetical protein